MYLLDTNICIYFMKNTYPNLTKKLLSHDPSKLLISSISVFELEYGVCKSKWMKNNRLKLAMFLSPFHIIPFTSEDAVAAGNLRCYLERQGTPIGPYDTQIAAQGLARGATIITRNTREFSRVPALALEDWV